MSKQNNYSPSMMVSGSAKSKEFSIDPASTIDTNIDIKSYINSWITVPNKGGKLNINSTFDTDNVSSYDSRLIDGNINTICFNNIQRSSNNLNFVGVDLQGTYNIDKIDIYWYGSAYSASSMTVQAGNDVNNLTDIVTLAGEWKGDRNVPQEIYFDNLQCRYIRVRCNTGNNLYYFVMTKLEVFEKSEGYQVIPLNTVDYITIEGKEEKVNITNSSSQKINLIVNYS